MSPPSPRPSPLNVTVLSSSGKPIFSRSSPSPGSSVTAAGLIAALCSFSEDAGLPVRRLERGNVAATLMRRGFIFLAAVETRPPRPKGAAAVVG